MQVLIISILFLFYCNVTIYLLHFFLILLFDFLNFYKKNIELGKDKSFFIKFYLFLKSNMTYFGQVGVTVTAPSRRPVTARVLDVVERPGVYRIEFTPDEVGTHLIDVSIILNVIYYITSHMLQDFSNIKSQIIHYYIKNLPRHEQDNLSKFYRNSMNIICLLFIGIR